MNQSRYTALLLLCAKRSPKQQSWSQTTQRIFLLDAVCRIEAYVCKQAAETLLHVWMWLVLIDGGGRFVLL